MGETIGLILGSAGVGALISGLINGVFNWRAKRAEMERRDLEMALKMAELKHQQLVVTHDWSAKAGKDLAVDFFDPLVSVIAYCDGMKEYRRTGRWLKGEAGHKKASS